MLTADLKFRAKHFFFFFFLCCFTSKIENITIPILEANI
jgi:hypothetical protein